MYLIVNGVVVFFTGLGVLEPSSDDTPESGVLDLFIEQNLFALCSSLVLSVVYVYFLFFNGKEETGDL